MAKRIFIVLGWWCGWTERIDAKVRKFRIVSSYKDYRREYCATIKFEAYLSFCLGMITHRYKNLLPLSICIIRV